MRGHCLRGTSNNWWQENKINFILIEAPLHVLQPSSNIQYYENTISRFYHIVRVLVTNNASLDWQIDLLGIHKS
jgi:hypothetical protein